MICYTCAHFVDHSNDICGELGCSCTNFRSTPWRCTNCNHERLHIYLDGTRPCTREGCNCYNFNIDFYQMPNVKKGHLVTVKDLYVVAVEDDLIKVRTKGNSIGTVITVPIQAVTEYCEAPPESLQCASLYKEGTGMYRCTNKEGHSDPHVNGDTLFSWFTHDEVGKFISTT